MWFDGVVSPTRGKVRGHKNHQVFEIRYDDGDWEIVREEYLATSKH
eukprot:CAMPEP_0185787886 /NCGR_PEP_ID=MMETSP1174-20130828/143272_1 /TAXON_ID=35687 /ORGANISM="Dictyocha speculum, Strain CCMP1381" /LENGTH=45 /DNA_ID= /DNA_START= /DNA_END= /DNA_ORIENTATION=